MKNKKGQYRPNPLYDQPSPFGMANPVLIIGIFVYVISFFVDGILESLASWGGLVLIILGCIATVYDISINN